MSCSDTIFKHISSAFITDKEEVITVKSRVDVAPCGQQSEVLLSDLIFTLTDKAIPSWMWTTSYLISMNGSVYLPSVVKDNPYIRGLNINQPYIKHLNLSLLYIPFSQTRIKLDNTLVPTSADPVSTTLVIPYTGTVNRVILAIAGKLILPTAMVANGTSLTVTLTPEQLNVILNPPPALIYPPIVTVGNLVNHPGTFMLVTSKDITYTLKPVGVTSLTTKFKEPIYGPPPNFGCIGLGELGEVLPYIYLSLKNTRARYCTPGIKNWLTISQ